MSNKKRISEFTEVFDFENNDEYPIIRSATNKKVKGGVIKDEIVETAQDFSLLGSKVGIKSTDTLIINDVDDGGAPKEIEVSELTALSESYAFVGDTAGSTEVELATKATTVDGSKTETTEFKVKKPIEVYVSITFSINSNGSGYGALEVSQNGDWRAVGQSFNSAATSGTTNVLSKGCQLHGGTTTTYNIYGITLNPGKYRVRNTGVFTGSSHTITTTVKATGVWAGELTTASILE
jgi:hypothetical protein